MMKPKALLGGWLVGLLLALVIGGAALAGGAGSSARGTFREPDRFVEFNSRGSGTDATGHVTIHFNDENVIEFFDVTCLNVVGSDAFIRAQLSHVSPPSFTTATREVVLLVGDNEASGHPDRYSYGLVPVAQPCRPPVGLGDGPMVLRGDIVVREG
jgi:hypothetical protein